MKKLVLAMACVLSLGLLASCKQGTQDVNLKNQAATEGFRYFGSVSFSAAKQNIVADNTTTGTSKFEASTAKTSMTYSDKEKFASISYRVDLDKPEGNFKTYTLGIPYVIDSDTDTNLASDLTYGSFTVNIYKIGDKYYTDDANKDATTGNKTKAEVKFSKGNPESETFTIESLGVLKYTSNNPAPDNWSVSNITFTRAK